jgi:hypothetical protein
MDGIRKPEARSEGLLVEELGDELLVYDLESKDVHNLSPLAAAVFTHCDGQTPPSRIAELAEERLGKPVSEDDVSIAVAQLQERMLLESQTLAVHEPISRRSFMRKSAVVGGAAVSLPLIASIAAPTAAMALTSIPPGCTGCGKNSDCITNHCCQTVSGKDCLQTCCVTENNSCHFVDNDCPSPPCACTVDLATCPTCPPGSVGCCTLA